MIWGAEVADICCRQMVDLRAAELCRAPRAQHSPAVAVFLLLSPNFGEEREKERREDRKGHTFQMSDWIFTYNLSLQEQLWGFLFTSKRTALLILLPWKLVRRAVCWPCVALPPSLLFCLSLFTRPDQEYTGFLWDPIKEHWIKCHFSLPAAMWSIRRVFLQYINQIYLGITNQNVFLLNTKDALSLSEYLC